VDRAAARGVRRLVLLSGRGGPQALVSEDTVRRSGLEWTVARSSWFNLGDLFHMITDGRNASVADGVRRALGGPPRDFADYARATAATGVWDVALR
jgi:uncharacterized protein YbjT (DUF2867 family)